MRSRTVCRSHGGAGGRPPIHGKYTIRGRLGQAYEQLMKHPEVLDLNDNIALLEARIGRLLRNMVMLIPPVHTKQHPNSPKSSSGVSSRMISPSVREALIC